MRVRVSLEPESGSELSSWFFYFIFFNGFQFLGVSFGSEFYLVRPFIVPVKRSEKNDPNLIKVS
jgi:hypothetical protein